MKTVRFNGRRAVPQSICAGVQMDNGVEQIMFILPQIAEGQTETLHWVIDDHEGMVILDHGLWTVYDPFTQYAGAHECYVEIWNNDILLWHSHPFMIHIADLPNVSGGGGGIDYNNLENKPIINGVELVGDKSLSDLGIADARPMIAMVENGDTASTVLSQGQYIVWKDAVYEVIDFIMPGTAFSVGTNIELVQPGIANALRYQIEHASGYVRYDQRQNNLTEEDRARIRFNAGAISNEELIKMASVGKTVINLADYDPGTYPDCVIPFTIDSTGHAVRLNTTDYKSYQIKRKDNLPCVAITANDVKNAYITFCNHDLGLGPSHGTDLSSYICSGTDAQYMIPAGTTVLFDFPSDCTFIVIRRNFGSSSPEWEPDSVIITTGVSHRIDELEEEIADISGMKIHICTSSEYDAVTRIPTVQNPSSDTFYLVPAASGSSPDLFVEWIYTNNAWEQFGSASIDLTDYARIEDVPTKVSDLQNDSGFITGYTETDPTVPSWAKASSKPTYTASEVGALPANTPIPTKVSDLTDDSGHYTKPSGGIPKTDLSSAVQASLDKADTALQGSDVSIAVETWLEENITNPDSPPLDRSLSLSSAAAPADMVGELKSAIETLEPNATANDIGKALKVKTVSDGKVTEYEFGAGSEPVITTVYYDDEDAVDYASTNSSSGANQTVIIIAPNITSGYFVRSAAVYAAEGTDVKFSVYRIEPYYNTPDVLNRKKFIKLYDIAVIKANADSKAEITFDVPLNLVGGETVLGAATQTGAMKYGAYKDAAYTIFEYNRNWYDLKQGEYYDYPQLYITSGNCPTYDISYVAAYNVATEEYNPDEILQKDYNFNPYDLTIDEHSNNAVRNSALYNELNIVKTETIVPVETEYKNGETPNGYYYGVATLEVPFGDIVLLKKVDVRAYSGTVLLGIWTFRHYQDNPEINRGYFTLKASLGSQEVNDTHAVFTLNDVEFDPTTDILIALSDTGKLSRVMGVESNGLRPLVDNHTDTGMSSTAVGQECSTLFWYHNSPAGSSNYSSQCGYAITYQLKDAKTITTVTNVKHAVDGLIDDVDRLKTNFGVSAISDTLRKPLNKYFVVIVDDLTRKALDIADRLLAKGIKPAYALKMETMGSEITWDEVKQLQDMGFEICFHGMLHSRYPAGSAPANDDVMIADIAEFKALCDTHGIVLHGYAGPNHYPLPVGAFKEFEWARGPYGLETYGAPGRLATTFASVAVWSCDPVNNAIPVADMKAAANNVGNNQYLSPMCHTDNLYEYIDDYMEVFEDWISKGLTPLRPMDAIKQSLFNVGGIGFNNTFDIQAGTATNPYYLISGNGAVLHNP